MQNKKSFELQVVPSVLLNKRNENDSDANDDNDNDDDGDDGYENDGDE